MPTQLNNILALSSDMVIKIRLYSMLTVLVVSVISGYIAHNKFSLPQALAKRLMTLVLIAFNWVVSLFVIWRIPLIPKYIWLPIVGVALMVTITIISHFLFLRSNMPAKSKTTMTLAGGLSNISFTGAAFICYAFYGKDALALANLYLVLWLPAVYLIFFPILRYKQLNLINDETVSKSEFFSFKTFLDPRFLVVYASALAVILNLANVPFPKLVSNLYIVDLFIYTGSAIAFFSIGLRVKIFHFKRYLKNFLQIAFIKFLLTPLIALSFVLILFYTGQDLTELMRKVIIILSAAPSAVLVVTMSNVYDLDAPLASFLWVSTMIAFVIIVVPALYFALN